MQLLMAETAGIGTYVVYEDLASTDRLARARSVSDNLGSLRPNRLMNDFCVAEVPIRPSSRPRAAPMSPKTISGFI